MNILIVRVSSLGDVVHNMPLLADVHRHFPDAQIDWVVEEAYTDLVGLNPHVRSIIPIALRRWRKRLWSASVRAEIAAFYRRLRAVEYDLVLDTQGLLKTGLVMQMARLAPGGRRAGLANATEDSGYEPLSRLFHHLSVTVELRAHAVARGRAVAAAALGYAATDEIDFALQAPAASTSASRPWSELNRYAVFFHGTAGADKQWPIASWREIAAMLAARGMPVLLPWGDRKELARAQQIAADLPNVQVLPQLNLMDAVALAQGAALAIGVDTGLTHVAAAYCRPTIELYIASPRWKTEGYWSPNIVNLGDAGAVPSVAEVAAAIDNLLGPADPAAELLSDPANRWA
ncbi:lipopolysaccharide heptosyltransferase I [Oxalobacteraceae bacterium CAVE-383]|nr:lipopolysaccharide heptosyltransferase I [Oxalobacteraceae bacterium CAVE-383]